METEKRCEECGSWDRCCSADAPVDGCGCCRCAGVTIARLRVRIGALDAEVARLKTQGIRVPVEWLESIKYGPTDGCFSGDCPHERVGDCVESLKKNTEELATEAEQYLAGHTPPKPVDPTTKATASPDPRDQGELCQRCGLRDSMAWLADDALWLKVMGDASGLLCLPCFHAQCVANGLVIGAVASEMHADWPAPHAHPAKGAEPGG